MKFQLISDKDRKINLNMDRVNIYTSRWKEGTSFEVFITRRQAKRSDPLRHFYFGYVLPPFMEKLGYEKDEELFFHHQLKIRYFGQDPKYNIYQDDKGIWRNVPSVFGNDSDMDVEIKRNFTEWVIRRAAFEGVYVENLGEHE